MGEFDGLRVQGEPKRETDVFVVPGKEPKDTGEFSGMRTVETAVDPARINVEAARSLKLNADAEAKAYNNSKKSNLPVSVTREQPDAFDDDFDGWEESAPEVKSYLGKDVNNAAMSRGDFENLGFVDRIIKGVSQHLAAGKLNNAISDLYYQQLTEGETPELNKSIAELEAQRFQLRPIRGQGFFERGIFGAVEQAPLLGRTIAGGAKGGVAGAVAGAGTALAIGNLSPLVAVPEEPITVTGFAIKGYALGSRAGSAREIYKLESGGAFGEFLKIRDVNGQPIDRDIIRLASHAVGIVNAGLELIGFGALLKTVPGGDKLLGRITTNKVKELLKREAVQKALSGVLVRFGGAVTTETITEMAQEAVNILAAEISKGVSERRQGTFFRPFDDVAAGERLIEIGKRTIETTTILAGGPSVANVSLNIINKNDSQEWTTKQNQINQAVNETKTKERSPDHIERILEEYGQDAEVYLSFDGLQRLFQAAPNETDNILKKVGLNPSEVESDSKKGVDTSVLASKIHAQLTPEEYDLIKDDLKPAPGAYTNREIETQKANEDIQNSMNLLNEEMERAERVEEQIVRIQGEGKKAGLAEDVATNAPILLKGLADRLETMEVDPVEFLQKVKIRKGRVAETIARIKEKADRLFQLDDELPSPEARGELIFDKENLIINLFDKADLSTVLHEVGHIALLEYTALENTEQASDLLQKDMAIIRKWVKAEKGVEFTREQSEQFAKGFELWLTEGKAPAAELIPAFERFKQWLKSVYGTVKAASESLGVKLNPKVRSVFDRMLSASLEVEQAAQSGGFTIKTTDEMNELGVTKPDQIFARKLIDITTKKAERRLTQARNKGHKDNIVQWREDANKEVRQENPIYDTVDLIIKENRIIDRDQFIERYTKEAIAFLPDKRLIKKDGLNIDTVAALYEFEDAFDMTNQFFTTPKLGDAVAQRVNEKQAAHDAQFQAEDFMVDQKEYRDYLNLMSKYIGGKTVAEADIQAGIKRNTPRWTKEATREIKAELPDLSEKSLQDAIDGRVQEKTDKFRQTRGRGAALTNETMKRVARDTMKVKTVKDARRVDKYLSAMKKASSDERRAILRKDWGAASQANELARFNYEMAGLSVKIRNEVDTVLKRAKRIGKTSTVDFEHKEAILNIIDRYSLAPLTQSDPTHKPDFAKLFAGDSVQKNDFYNDGFDVPGFMLINEVDDFRQLRMEQFRDVDKAIRYLEKQGRLDLKDKLADGVTSLQETVDESKETMDKVKPLKKWERGSMLRKLSDTARKFFARLDSLNFIAKSLDGYTNLGKDGKKGIVERLIIDKIKDAENALTLDWKRIQGTLKPHLDQISKTIRSWNKKFGGHIRIENAPVPELLRNDGQTKGWKANQIFAVVLNTGNVGEVSNFQNLLSGYDDLNPGAIESIKNMLTVEDMDAVQGIWDVIDSLFKQVDAQHTKTKNYRMSKIEATPFIFKGKKYEGGYYPIKHDRALSYQVADRGKIEDLFNHDAASFQTPYTRSGHTKERQTGVALPILLDLSIIDSHFRDALQYIHFTDVIRDADRITRNHDFRKSATRILGKDVYDTIRPSLQHIANAKKEGLDVPGARAVEWMRGLSTLYVLAWNTGVALKQPLSTFGAIKDMGAKAYMDGFISTLMSPSVHYQKMLDLSPYMKNRLTAFDREVRSAFNKLTSEQKGVYFGDTKVTWQDVKNFGFWQIRVADTTTVLPIWHGAFRDKLLPDQSNLDEAIRYADDIVRNSQPSAAPLDLSSWQRDAGAIRLFSQFQTFTVGKYGQRQRLHYRAWRNKSISTVDYAWFNFMDAFVPLVSINMLMGLLWGRDFGDEETQQDIMFDVLQSWAFMGVPLVSQIARSVTRYGDPFDSPVLETANKLVRGAVSGAQGLNGFKNKKERDRALWGVAHAISIILGVPVSKIVGRAERGAKQKKGVPGAKYLVPAPPGK